MNSIEQTQRYSSLLLNISWRYIRGKKRKESEDRATAAEIAFQVAVQKTFNSAKTPVATIVKMQCAAYLGV